jgi:hypothetical protein
MKSSIGGSLWAKLFGRMHLQIGFNDRHDASKKYRNCSASHQFIGVFQIRCDCCSGRLATSSPSGGGRVACGLRVLCGVVSVYFAAQLALLPRRCAPSKMASLNNAKPPQERGYKQ